MSAEVLPSNDEITAWVLRLCRAAKIHVEVFPDGTMGLIDVPAKYVAVIDGMHIALLSVAMGDGLPEINEPTEARPKA